MLGVGAAMQVLGEQIHGPCVGDHVGMQTIEMLGRHRLAVFPPDRRLRELVAHNKLVMRRAAGVRTRRGDESSAVGDLGLATPNRLFIETWRIEIAKDIRLILNTGESDRDFRIKGINSMHGDFLDFGRAERIGALSSKLGPSGFDDRSSVGKIWLNCQLGDSNCRRFLPCGYGLLRDP